MQARARNCCFISLSVAFLALVGLPAQASRIDIFATSGLGFSRISNNPNIQLDEITYNRYEVNQQTSIMPLVGAGIGHTFNHLWGKPFDLSLAATSYYMNFGSVKGTEYPFANMGETNATNALSYQFKARTVSLFLEPKFIYTKYVYQPYILAGVGAGRNNLYKYAESATTASNASPTQNPFASHTMTSFAYEAALGVQKQLAEDMKNHIRYQLAVDYRYMNFGKGELGASAAQTTNQRLKVSHLDTQAIMLSLGASIA